MFFQSTKGKIGLILITLFVIGIVWYSKRLMSEKGTPFGSYISVNDIRYRVYAYKQENVNKIKVSLFVQNKLDEERIIHFKKIYVNVINLSNDKTVFKKVFIKNVKFFFKPRRSEIYSADFNVTKPGVTYQINGVFIDGNNERIIVNTEIKVKQK